MKSDQTISSEESDVSDSFVNLKSTFRVRVCLQRYFDDVRARSYILVSRTRRVRWLQERLRKVFSLSGAFCLCADGHLLPPTEPLGLLCPEDRVEVIPLQDGQCKEQNVGDALDIIMSNGNDVQKVIKSSPSFSDGTKIAQNGISSESEHFNNYVKKNDHNITSFIMSTGDYVDGVTEPAEPDMEGSNADTIDTGLGASVCTDQNDSGETHILLKRKRDALALLEARCELEAADYETGSEEARAMKRPRRRVRRRGRRGASAAPAPAGEPPADTAAPTSPGAVARNDVVCARRPRLVQSL